MSLMGFYVWDFDELFKIAKNNIISKINTCKFIIDIMCRYFEKLTGDLISAGLLFAITK